MPTLITAVAYEHEARCGECDLSGVFARGDRDVQEWTERIWPEVQEAMARKAMWGRRN